MLRNTNAAKREAFMLVAETCPHVDKALEIAAEAIKNQTGALREALIEALERAMTAEDQVDELNAEIRRLEALLDTVTE